MRVKGLDGKRLHAKGQIIMGWTIVRHSFVLLFRNLTNALKASVGPYLIGIGVAIAALTAAGIPLNAFSAGVSPQESMMVAQGIGGGTAFLAILLVAVVILFVSSWVAVSWHRFVLLEEYPGALPAIAGRPIWPYLGQVVILVIVIALVSIPLAFLIGLISVPFLGALEGGQPTGGFVVVSTLLGIAFAAILSWLWLRWGLSLPSRAVGNPITMGESWSATRPLSGAILAASLILFAISFATTIVIDRVFGAGLIGVALNLIVNWISIMVGISVLTTLYGHLVEKRKIS